ncbi:hypothetical protein [Psychromonas ingrahamii]|uniref:hypothetical protein n=1 Tax=Psychromonas ingrahamii TaxID=357794 RepID=UPI0012ED021A|nr:hypothetical protein [Psychromonas ingrahamii]
MNVGIYDNDLKGVGQDAEVIYDSSVLSSACPYSMSYGSACSYCVLVTLCALNQ